MYTTEQLKLWRHHQRKGMENIKACIKRLLDIFANKFQNYNIADIMVAHYY